MSRKLLTLCNKQHCGYSYVRKGKKANSFLCQRLSAELWQVILCFCVSISLNRGHEKAQSFLKENALRVKTMKWGDLGGVQRSISHHYRVPSYLSSLQSLHFPTIFSFSFFFLSNFKLKEMGNSNLPGILSSPAKRLC